MKALVIGFGPQGRRHAHILGVLGVEVAVVSRRAIEAKPRYATIGEAIRAFDPAYAVIASRTDEHRDDMVALRDGGFKGTVLVEKPLFERSGAPADGFGRLFVGYNLRFHRALRRFKEILDQTQPHAVHAYVGQYLPDFQPGSDYRRSFRAKRAQGGGVLRDLSHELDYLNWMLGGWTRLTALGGQFSGLEIDSDDVFSLLFGARRCPVVTAQLNYLDSTIRREVLALTDKGSIRADLVAGTVEFDGNTETFKAEREDTFIAQHKAAMAGYDPAICTLAQGLDVVRMIDAAESAAESSRWIAA